MPGMSLDRVNPVIMADQGHLNDEIPAKTLLLVDAECCTNTYTLRMSITAIAAMATRKLGMP